MSTISGNTVKYPLKIGIIGMGRRATSFVTYFSQNSTDGSVEAFCDSIPEKAEAIAEHYGINPKIYSNIDDMLRMSSIDVLFVTTPDYDHVEPCLAALEKNIHVFCEKPMATTLEDCDKIIEAAQKSSGVFYLGFNLRHNIVYETIHEIISSNRLGKVTTIETNEYYYGGKTYFRRWNRFRRYGGGLWLTKACHDFDLLNFMTNSKPQTVYAVGSLSHYRPKSQAAKQCRHCSLQFECPDYVDIMNVEDPESGIFNRLSLIGEQHGQEPGDLCLFNSEKDTFDNGMAIVTYKNSIRASYTLNVLGSRNTRQMRVVGTDGSLEADIEEGIITVVERHTNRQYRYDMHSLMAGSHSGADSRMVKDFLLTIRKGKKPKTSWKEGRLAVQLSLSARESMDTGKVISIKG